MNEWIYYAIDNSLSASGQQDEQLKYHSQRFNAMSTIKSTPVNKTKKGIDFNTSAATMAEEDKKVSEVLILIPIFQYSSL